MEDNCFRIEDGILEKYLGEGGDVIIPSGIIAIKRSAFSACRNVTSVTISVMRRFFIAWG